MRKRIVVAVVLAVLIAASAYAQTKDFFDLVKTGTLHDIQAAINQGANVNARNSAAGTTPLMYAAGSNPNPEVITTLLKAGADIEARDSLNGGTALLWAATLSTPEAVTTLLRAGAKIEAQDNSGWTALMRAAFHNANPKVIIVLLNARADAKAKDKVGKTALDYAQYNPILGGTDALKKLEEASK